MFALFNILYKINYIQKSISLKSIIANPSSSF